MGERYLTILEVSQKQAYIFASNRLRDNIINSAVIAWIMSSTYFEQVINNPCIYSEKENMVYSGGGHTVLEFPTEENAVTFAKRFLSKQYHILTKGIQLKI